MIQVLYKEINNFFNSLTAYIVVVVFLTTIGLLMWVFPDTSVLVYGYANMETLFRLGPYVFMFLVPAITMRLWAEERRLGTIELLLTLPITQGQAVLGKFLAAWAFIGVALILTFPIWITVNYLGSPDNGVILASYIGSFLMAGAFLAIASCLSACTRNQVIAFILTVVVCFLFLLAGFPLVLDFFSAWAPQGVVDAVSGLSFLTHFTSIGKGVIELRDVIYFALTIAFWLYASAVVIDLKKAD